MTFRTPLVTAWLALALAANNSAAAPQHAAATRAELTQWLERLRAEGTDVASPLRWRYSFAASATARLEALSLELVAAGYAIEALATGAEADAQLSVTRTELLTPTGLERRNRDLRSLAGKHGARYVGVDVAPTGRP